MPANGKSKNIQIPFEIFKDIIAFMECCDITDCDPDFQKLYRRIFSTLLAKQDSLELRDAYAKIVFAEGEEQKKKARIAYLEQKELNNG